MLKKIKICFKIVLIFFLLLIKVSADDLEMKIYRLKHARVESLYSVIDNLKSSDGKVSVDSNTNSLIIVDHPQNLERIADIINELDAAQKMVEIKVLVIDATDTFLDRIGLHGGHLVIPKGEFSVILTALKGDKTVKTRSEMMVKTLSNHPAQLTVSTDELFGYTVTNYYYHHPRSTTYIIRRPVGDFLEALPTVNNDGTITVVLRPQSSSLQEDGTAYEKTVVTQLQVKSGDTIAIGGFDSATQETQTESSWFGFGISRRNKAVAKKMAMFLTATAMD